MFKFVKKQESTRIQITQMRKLYTHSLWGREPEANVKSGHWGSCIEHISANAGFHQLSCRAEVWFPKRDSSFLLSPGSPWRVRLPWFCTWASSLGPSAHLSSQEGQLVNPLGAGCVVFLLTPNMCCLSNNQFSNSLKLSVQQQLNSVLTLTTQN